MKPERQQQIAFARMIGHSLRSRPKAVQRARPKTVNPYMRAEIAAMPPV